MNSINNSLRSHSLAHYIAKNSRVSSGKQVNSIFSTVTGSAEQTGNAAHGEKINVGLGNWRAHGIQYRMSGSISRFPANRPFSITGFAAAHHPFYLRGYLCQNTGVFNRNNTVTVFREDGTYYVHEHTHPGYSFIPYRYNDGSDRTHFCRSETQFVEAGKNWQTLRFARNAFRLAGLEGAPNSISELTDTHIAMAVFMNKLSISRFTPGVISFEGVNFNEKLYDPYFEHGPNRERSDWLLTIGLAHHGHQNIEMTPFVMFGIASRHMFIETFFSERNIEAMVSEISGMFDSEIDVEFLHSAITETGRWNTENHYRSLEYYFDFTANRLAEYIYVLFTHGDFCYSLDATVFHDDPNFIEFKASARDLHESMFAEALFSLATGDRRDVKSMWDNMWTEDRLFNIKGRMYTLREMDDRRFFLMTGLHREEYDEEACEDEIEPKITLAENQNAPLSVIEQLLTALARRFSMHNNMRLHELMTEIGKRRT